MKDAFAERPGKCFTTAELVSRAYPDTQTGRSHLNAVRRALKGLTAELVLKRFVTGTSGRRGWHCSYRMPSGAEDPERVDVLRLLAQLER